MAAPLNYLPTPGGILALIRDGRASSRSDVARLTGLAPSTVTLRIEQLVAAGYLAEHGEGASRGGRRPRVLHIASDSRRVAGVDLGARHAQLALFDLSGALVAEQQCSLDITEPPEMVLREVHERLQAMLGAMEGSVELVSIGLALPGPVSVPEGRVISPSRMPGWNGVDPAAILAGISGVRVHSENDANAMAYGEFVAGGRSVQHMILVKAGSSIGTGLVVAGSLYRGARGMAGDVSHTAVTGGSQVLCSCGRFGCLDAVAGGRAIMQSLSVNGVVVEDVAAVVALARDAHPLATRLLREAGLRTGAVLATLVSALNPDRLVLGGSLSAAEVFVAAVRSSVYDCCLPMSTNGLEVGESRAGKGVGAMGVAAIVIDDLLSPASVDEELRAT